MAAARQVYEAHLTARAPSPHRDATAARAEAPLATAEKRSMAPSADLKTVRMATMFSGEHLPNNPIWGTRVTYLSPAERQAFKLHIRQGKLYDAAGNLFDTGDAASVHDGGGGRAIAVMDAEGNLYASKYREVGKFHHSSLTAGEPVAYAGEIKVEEGVLTEISNRSGHYGRPKLPSIKLVRSSNHTASNSS